jgi:hypothetical protein
MRSLGSVVPAALVELLRATPISAGKVAFAWRTSVGPALDRATSVRLERGVLIVEASSPDWGRAVAQSSSLILERLRAFLGQDAVARIEIRPAR